MYTSQCSKTYVSALHKEVDQLCNAYYRPISEPPVQIFKTTILLIVPEYLLHVPLRI